VGKERRKNLRGKRPTSGAVVSGRRLLLWPQGEGVATTKRKCGLLKRERELSVRDRRFLLFKPGVLDIPQAPGWGGKERRNPLPFLPRGCRERGGLLHYLILL